MPMSSSPWPGGFLAAKRPLIRRYLGSTKNTKVKMQSKNADDNDEAPDEFNNDDGIEHDHPNFDGANGGVGKGEGKIDESQPKILPTMVLHRLIR